MKLKEIGSTYWLSPNTTNGFMRKSLKTPDVFEGASYVSTCRSAIGIVLDILLPSEHKVALLPAFTCESVLVAFVDRGYVVYPYPIRRDLTIAWNQFLERIEKVQPSVVLVSILLLSCAHMFWSCVIRELLLLRMKLRACSIPNLLPMPITMWAVSENGCPCLMELLCLSLSIAIRKI